MTGFLGYLHPARFEVAGDPPVLLNKKEEIVRTLSEKLKTSARGQVMPREVQPFGAPAFEKTGGTEIRWLGGAGIFVNSRGTALMIDPVLEGFDMPLLFDPPIAVRDVPHLDAVLATHIDNDHFSRDTCLDLKAVCASYHAPQYVAEVMREIGLPGFGHDIGETFSVGQVNVTLTPAEHNWQNGMPEYSHREWKKEDYCGFWLDTPDGSLWTPGDSRLLPEQLAMPREPDILLMDFADNGWHISFDGAVKLANTYPNAEIVCIHWGTVDAPDWDTFNGDPARLAASIVDPGRVHALFPGEAFRLGEK